MNKLIWLFVVGAVTVIVTEAFGRSKRAPEIDWHKFKLKYGKVYRDEREESSRISLFEQSNRRIAKFNSERTNKTNWSMGTNHMSDWTQSGKKNLNGLKVTSSIKTLPRASVGVSLMKN